MIPQFTARLAAPARPSANPAVRFAGTSEGREKYNRILGSTPADDFSCSASGQKKDGVYFADGQLRPIPVGKDLYEILSAAAAYGGYSSTGNLYADKSRIFEHKVGLADKQNLVGFLALCRQKNSSTLNGLLNNHYAPVQERLNELGVDLTAELTRYENEKAAAEILQTEKKAQQALTTMREQIAVIRTYYDMPSTPLPDEPSDIKAEYQKLTKLNQLVGQLDSAQKISGKTIPAESLSEMTKSADIVRLSGEFTRIQNEVKAGNTWTSPKGRKIAKAWEKKFGKLP